MCDGQGPLYWNSLHRPSKQRPEGKPADNCKPQSEPRQNEAVEHLHGGPAIEGVVAAQDGLWRHVVQRPHLLPLNKDLSGHELDEAHWTQSALNSELAGRSVLRGDQKARTCSDDACVCDPAVGRTTLRGRITGPGCLHRLDDRCVQTPYLAFPGDGGGVRPDGLCDAEVDELQLALHLPTIEFGHQ